MPELRLRLMPAVCATFLALASVAQTTMAIGTNNQESADILEYRTCADRIAELGKIPGISEAHKQAIAGIQRRLDDAIAAAGGRVVGRWKLEQQTLKEKEAVLQGLQPSAAGYSEALAAVVEQCCCFADAVAGELRKSDNAPEAADLRKEATAVLAATEKNLEGIVSASKQLLQSDQQGSEMPLLVASFGIGRVVYARSCVMESESPARRSVTKKALDLLTDFTFEFSDSFAAYEAHMILAHCQVELGHPELAMQECDEAIGLCMQYARDSAGVWQVEREAADVIAEAVLQKMHSATDRAVAVRAGQDYFATVFEGIEARNGKSVLHLLGSSYLAIGDLKNARTIADRLLQIDPRGRWGGAARWLKEKIVRSSKFRLWSVPEELEEADSLAMQGEFERALNSYRGSMTRAVGADEQFAARAMMGVGTSQLRLGMRLEAVGSFDEVVKRYPDSEQAPEALWQCSKVLRLLAVMEHQESYKKSADARAELLRRDYPTSRQAASLHLEDGESKEKEGDLLGAVHHYELVEPASAGYHEARLRIGDMYAEQFRRMAAGNALTEAGAAKASAMACYRTLLISLAEAKKSTPAEQQLQIDRYAFDARVKLVSLCLVDGANLVEADKLLADIGNAVCADREGGPKRNWPRRISSEFAPVAAASQDGRGQHGVAPGAPDRRTVGAAVYGRRFSRGRISGASKGATEAVAAGLEWLCKHQDEDGHWDCAKFMKHDTDGVKATGPGDPKNDVGVTGLALLALLADGNTLKIGVFREELRRGVQWLVKQQDEKGLLCRPLGPSYVYSHAIATLALCEAYGLSEYRPLKGPAQKAVDYILRARDPVSVWGYQPGEPGGDTSVTSWMVQALAAAEAFDLQVDRSALQVALAYFDVVTDPSSGTAGYTKKGEGSSRPLGKLDKFPVAKTEALTGAVLFCRFLLRQNPKDVKSMEKAANALLGKPPVWNEKDGSIDMYYWYYGSYAMFQYGGKYWDTWSKKLVEVAIKAQHREGNPGFKGPNFRGSWDPVDPWGEEGGRVYSTAMMVLSLESNYRMGRVALGR